MTAPSDEWPSNASLNEQLRKIEGIGKLRIFVGAAPGVGKTYQMLQQAGAKRDRRRRNRGGQAVA